MQCNQAIPRGTLENHSTVISRTKATSCLTIMMLCVTLLSLTGCKKKAETTQTVPGQPGATQVAVPQEEGKTGRNSVLQVPFDNVAKLVLLNIGRAYQMATISENRPPKNAEEAGLEPRNLKTKRDMQDHEVEVLYGVDVKKLGDDPGQYALAWEKTPTNDGYRLVLMADFQTVKYLPTAEFEKLKKAK